jgi:hypothetical protein
LRFENGRHRGPAAGPHLQPPFVHGRAGGAGQE